MEKLAHAEHFESFERQETAAKLGMWIFLVSELLLFAAGFVLYGGYRTSYGSAFTLGVTHNDLFLGTLNTYVLICSSFSVAMSLNALRMGQKKKSIFFLALTLFMALLFLVIKGTEYAHHFHEGIYPGGIGGFFLENQESIFGLTMFFNIYYALTGLHAVHVVIGMIILAVMAFRIHTGTIQAKNSYVLELGALYWHLVDIIWIFLWPLFYLSRGGAV